MKLGVFGGTFDPPHVGHLVAAQEVIFRLGLDRLLLVPAAIPPHKLARDVTPSQIRLNMLKAATAGLDRIEVSEVEMERGGPSYTVETLQALHWTSPRPHLFLVMGADQLAEFDSWREPDVIRHLATLVAFDRAGEGPPRAAPVNYLRVEIPRLDVSSTEIRRRVANGEPVRYLIPDPVGSIIESEGLYRQGG